MSLNKIVEFLNANPVQYLATVGRDGKAKCRPFMFAGELDGKLWFCTNNQKDVSRICRPTPHRDLGVQPEYAWIRLHGKAVFENNMAAKEMSISNPIVKGQRSRPPPFLGGFNWRMLTAPLPTSPATLPTSSDSRFVQIALETLFSGRFAVWYRKGGLSMTQTERRRFLLSRLLAEAPEYRQLAVPDDAAGQKQLLRALLNVFKYLDKEIYTRLLTA